MALPETQEFIDIDKEAERILREDRLKRERRR